MFKLGKLPAKKDGRNLKFRSLLPKKLPQIPQEYDVDFDNPDVWPLPLPIFANDQWGDCVIAGRANFTMRAEKIEQGELVEPTDQEVLSEYWKEQGDPTGQERPDNGLYILESLKVWRNQGWVVGGKQYDIYGFAEINRAKLLEIRQAIYLLGGVIVGVSIHQADMDAFGWGNIWDTTENCGPFLGGHCMYGMGYMKSGSFVFMTWGRRVVVTPFWLLSHVDEIYGIVDNRDKFLGDKSPVDVEKLDAYLKTISGSVQK